MSKIQKIFEEKTVLPYLQKRGLLNQYKKAKQLLLEGHLLSTRFKERNPKGSGIWYFRVNKQYRAFGVFDSVGNLIIFKIDNHS